METISYFLLVIACSMAGILAMIGAFVLGLIVAEAGHRRKLRHLGLKLDGNQVVPIAGAWPREIAQAVLRQQVGHQKPEGRTVHYENLKVQ